MAQRRKEERVRKAELNRLDNEDCGEDEEEEEDMTDESEEEEVRGWFCYAAQIFAFTLFALASSCSSVPQGVDDLLGGGDGEEDDVKDNEDEEEEGSMAQSMRSPSPVALIGPLSTPDLINTDGTLMLFPGNSSSRTGYVCSFVEALLKSLIFGCKMSPAAACLMDKIKNIFGFSFFSDGVRRSGPSGHDSGSKMGG